MGLGIGIKDLDLGLGLKLKWGLGLKLAYRLKMTFELEVYLIDCGDAGLVRKYSRLFIVFRLLKNKIFHFDVR